MSVPPATPSDKGPPMSAIVSRLDPIEVAPVGSGRSYIINALSWRERAALEADLTREGGGQVFPQQVREARRAALKELAPDNLPELLAVLDEAEADDLEPGSPEVADLNRRLQVINAATAMVPGYAALLAQNARRSALLPFLAARYGLRDWSGPGLPPFARLRGVVPDALLEQVPESEIAEVGWTACRSGSGGYAHWPDAGGVADQAAWVVDAFGLLTGTAATWDEAERKRRAS